MLIRKFVSPICDGVLGIKPHAAVRVRWSATKFEIKETSVAEIVQKLELYYFSYLATTFSLAITQIHWICITLQITCFYITKKGFLVCVVIPKIVLQLSILCSYVVHTSSPYNSQLS